MQSLKSTVTNKVIPVALLHRSKVIPIIIDGKCLVGKAELLPLENVQCAQKLGRTHFLPPNHALACQQLVLLSPAGKAFPKKKSWIVALKGTNS